MDERKMGLAGKKILFLAPEFFGYEKKIKEKMEELGAQVDAYNERSVTSAGQRALLKAVPWIFRRKSRKYFRKIMEENRGKDYDYIFIIKCDMVPEGTLKSFRKEYPGARLCLYLYDSVKNIPGIIRKMRYFDTRYSFDRDDCRKYPGLRFRPLFYLDGYRRRGQNKSQPCYDISFCGTIHSDRYRIIKEVEGECRREGLRCFWFRYLQGRFMYVWYQCMDKSIRHSAIQEFSFEKMDSSQIAEIVSESRIILDIQHPGQSGLTMRTIEMIGMEKKMITTNPEVKQFDFYHPNNICVIERENIRIDPEFLRTPYEPLEERIYEKYSLETWVLEILSEGE